MPARKTLTARALAILTTAFFSASLAAQTGIGADAPSLEGGKWVVGNPVETFRPGRVYVIAFWYSTIAERPGALETMRTIAAANAPDAIVVCVSGDDREDDEFDDLLKQKDLPANLRVLKDDPVERIGVVCARWLNGMPLGSYPTTVIVDKTGKIAFVGDVLEAKAVLPLVLDGKLDARSAAAANDELADQTNRVQVELDARPHQHAALGDNAGAAEAIDELLVKYPRCRDKLLLAKFTYLLQAQQFEEAYEVADELAEVRKFDPMELNELAWMIVDEDWIARRDLDRALSISLRSNELSGNGAAAFVDTLARVYFEQGNLEKAVELQTKAVEIAQSALLELQSDLLPILNETLERYRAVPLPK